MQTGKLRLIKLHASGTEPYKFSISSRAGIQTQVSLAPKSMLPPHLSVSAFSRRQHLCVPGTPGKHLCPVHRLNQPAAPTIPTSLSGPFSHGTGGPRGEMCPLLAPASGRSLGIFGSLGRLRKTGSRFELALSAPSPESPTKGLRSTLSSSAEAAGNVYNRNQALESSSTDFLPISIL